ncbi:MAG TPA: zf-HC2 domain-containing protein [Gemmatimonadaceae bacterium]|jgi:hypothetical protein|nr:zf-HC2 domain-containing protein [Gemmatimonadaceae bacterium]
MMHVLPCDRVREHLEAFIDDELTLDEQVRIETHLQECVACRLEASELAEIGSALRSRSASVAAVPPEPERLTSMVLERVRLEQQFSFGGRLRDLFDDMHFVWAGLGATLAVILCVYASAGVLHAASNERPGSLAELIDYLANPGSNDNPVRVDRYMSLPRAYEPMVLTTDDDVEFAVAAVVTREGRVQNLELVAEQMRSLKVKPEVVLAMLDAAAQARFEPARSGGAPVAVSMVWLLSSTIVKGLPDYDMYLLRPPSQSVPAMGPSERVKPARRTPAATTPPAKAPSPTSDAADSAAISL